ncbi:hydrolase [Patescibacteria group bacterium]
MAYKKSKQCCQKFNPSLWDEKVHQWKGKRFIKDTLPQLFHMPFPPMIGRMIQRQWKKAQTAGAAPKMKDFLWLAHDPSPWKSEHYIAVTKKVPDAHNTKLSGTFISKVFDGPFNAVPKWIKEMDRYLAEKGKKSIKYYFYFTTCPKCAKKYGHNYVVSFAQVK